LKFGSQAGWRHALKERGLGNPVARVVTALTVVGVLTLLVAPWRTSIGPELTSSDVDRVAQSNVAATHDFTFEGSNAGAIARVREAAAELVTPIWDYDRGATEELESRISNAFGEVRRELLVLGREAESANNAALAAESSAANGGSVEEDGSGDSDFAPFSEPEPLSEDAAIALVSSETRDTVVADSTAIQALISSARFPDAVDIEAFTRDGFRVQTGDALRNLVRAATAGNLVEDSDIIQSAAASGITLRTLRGHDVENERPERLFRDWTGLDRVSRSIAGANHHLSYLEDLELRESVVRSAEALVRANTKLNEVQTAALIDATAATAERNYRSAQTQTFREGETIISGGDRISTTTVAILDEMRASAPPKQSRLQTLLGTGALVVLLIFPLLLFSLQNLPRFSRREKDLAMMCTVLLFHLLVTRLSIYFAGLVIAQNSELPLLALAALIPFAAGAMIVRILTTAENALLYALVYALLAGVLFDFDVGYTALALLSAVVGNASVKGAQSRTDILRASALVGVMTLGISMSMVLIRADGAEIASLYVAAGAILSGVTTVLFVFAILPLVEAVYRYTTPMRLMELANLNHPALKELILKAPGSYHHSMMVGQLVEAACEKVGADALLGRVGSYFHDIGKMKSPQYFAENQQGVNPHDKLKPNMSALIIKSHVKDGVELARQYKLPPEIINFIREHHGTSLIQYFYFRAQEQSDAEVSETDYRYPGPKPQTRETAICLLADGIEAASRALPDPSHSHLKGLVQKMINKAFTDGQLDECELTLRDLNEIAQAFLLRLTAFYHHRPEYPDARKSQSTRKVRKPDTASRPPASPNEPADDGADSQGGPNSDRAPDVPETGSSAAINLRRLGM
jgi:putative nucleotidyltransferase with HDIG domain